MTTQFERLPVKDWRVELLRVTAFPTDNSEFKADEWWSGIVGTEPEKAVTQSKLREKQIEGPFGEAQLTLRIGPGRIDWLVTRREESDDSEKLELSFVEALAGFSTLMHKWLPLSPIVERLAFGATVLFPVLDRETGYRRLAPYLPAVTLEPEKARDFLFRINRPRLSTTTNDLQINRLSTWSVAMFELKAFSVTSGRATITPGEKTFACRIEIDINTSPEYPGRLDSDQLPKVLRELVDLGTEIIRDGDVS